MLFGGTVGCFSGIVQNLTPLEVGMLGSAATHRLVSNGNFIYLDDNTGAPTLANRIGQFLSVTGQTVTINTTQGPRNVVSVTGVLPAGAPGCVPPPPQIATTPQPQPGGGNQNLLLLLLLSGALGGGGQGGRGGLDINSLLPLLLLGGQGGAI